MRMYHTRYVRVIKAQLHDYLPVEEKYRHETFAESFLF